MYENIALETLGLLLVCQARLENRHTEPHAKENHMPPYIVKTITTNDSTSFGNFRVMFSCFENKSNSTPDCGGPGQTQKLSFLTN